MYRKIRITLATVMFLGITLLFLDFTGTFQGWLGWMPRIQLVPALLSLSIVWVIALILITLCFGRTYCSVLCPMGIFQDVVSSLRRKKNRFGYSKPSHILRYFFLAIFLAGFFTGIHSLVTLLEPYSNYGRMAQSLFQPLYILGNNGLASLAEQADSYAFYPVDIWVRHVPTFLVTIGVFLLVVVLAWRGGRTYCNTICPVGTTLGLLSRFSFLKIRIDKDKCVNCGLCAKNCKSSCIDIKRHSIDASRCVVCFNCLVKCKKDAISYTWKRSVSLSKEASPLPTPSQASQPNSNGTKEQVDTNRRAFLIATAGIATAALAQEKKKVDGGLAVIREKAIVRRSTPVTPPGSISAKNMADHCTGCQLCVAACPNQVLRPSGGMFTLMQPVLAFEHGFCRPECNRCGEVCPAGAIRPISLSDKTSIHIGHAVWTRRNCVPLTDRDEQGNHVSCGNCERHCPTGAITMIPSVADDEGSPQIPAIDEERCIGCGACENLCPARPYPAIHVEGHEVHRID